MGITFAQIIVWLIVGLLGGTLAGVVVRWQRKGFGWWTNLGIGLVGALVGGASLDPASFLAIVRSANSVRV